MNEFKDCNFYNKIQSCERCELGSILYKGKSSHKYHIDCNKNPNCHYKQLLQSIQREKDLEKRNNSLCLRIIDLATELICEQEKNRDLILNLDKT